MAAREGVGSGAWALLGLALVILGGVAAAVHLAPIAGPGPDGQPVGQPGGQLAGQLAWGAAGLAWAAAVCLAPRVSLPSDWRAAGPVGVVVGAVLLRLCVLQVAQPCLSDDVQRYVWEGGLVAEGRSPYAFAPDAPELAGERARWSGVHGRMNNPGVSAAYPPLTEAACALVVTLCGGPAADGGAAAVRGLRVFFTLCDLAVLLPLAVLLRRRGRSPGWLVAWAWCPLVALEFAGSGHFDSLGIALFVTALALLEVARPVGLVALAGGILVKLLPVLAAPFALRGLRRPGSGALFLALLVGLGWAAVAPLEGGLRGIGSGLGEYGLRWESTNLLYRFVEPVVEELGGRFTELERDGGGADPRRLGRWVAGALWLGVGLVQWRRRRGVVDASFALTGAFLVLSPTLHPWYITWIVPFLALRPRRSVGAWAFGYLVVVAPLLYWPLPRFHSDGVWVEPAWLWPVVALPFLGLLVLGLVRPPAEVQA